MKSLKNLFIESLLDDEDDIISGADNKLLDDWLKKYASGDYKCRFLKDGTLKITGNIFIKGFNDEKLPHNLKISQMKGNFSIEKCPNLRNIEGVFGDGVFVEGNFTISNCNNFDSLIGCPDNIFGQISIVSNPKLKSLEGLPSWNMGNIYIMKNGKKFTQNQINAIQNSEVGGSPRKKIFCSCEDDENIIEEGLILEALNEPHLIELDYQIKNTLKDINDVQKSKELNNSINGKYQFAKLESAYKYGKGFIRDLMRKTRLPWNELDSSQVTEYDRVDGKVLTKLRKIVAQSNNNVSFVLLKDLNGNYNYVYDGDGKSIACIEFNKDLVLQCINDGYIPSEVSDLFWWKHKSSTEIIDIFKKAFSVVIIEVDYNDRSEVLSKRSKRMDSRQGMITNTPEQNLEIARENLERYKKIIAQNKVNDDPELKQLGSQVEKIMMETMKISQKAITNPSKYEAYEVGMLLDRINSTRSYERGRSYGFDGLLKIYRDLISTSMSVAKNGGYSYERDSINGLKKQLKDMIKEVEFMLNKF